MVLLGVNLAISLCAILRIKFPTGARDFAVFHSVGTVQPLVQWILGVLHLGLKWPVKEADHSPLSGTKTNNAFIYISTPSVSDMLLN